MKLADIPDDVIIAFFADGTIEKVEISRKNKEWSMTLILPKLVPWNVYETVCRKISNSFSHIAQIRLAVRYPDGVSDELLVQEYWPLFIQQMLQEAVSLKGWLARAAAEVRGKRVAVWLPDPLGLELCRKKQMDKKLERFFRERFQRQFQVLLQASEWNDESYSKLAKEIEEEEKSIAQQIISRIGKESANAEPGEDSASARFASVPTIRADASETAARRPAAAKVRTAPQDQVQPPMESVFQETPVPLRDIREETKRITVQGAVFGLESKELRNGATLFSFNVTDFTDSIAVKAFARTNEDLVRYRRLADGMWLKLRGRIEYDRFAPQPELTLFPLEFTETVPPSERMDDAEVKRVEFHLHTAMSAMDGIASAKEYIETAAKWGHKAIAITDHGGIQSFPEAAQAAKAYGIKVIYGMEAACFMI